MGRSVFEDDLNPRVFKASGLKHLDRVIDSVSAGPWCSSRESRLMQWQCAKHGIYTIIDLHSAPGGRSSIYQTGTAYSTSTNESGQNIEWHCDSGNHQALREGFLTSTPYLWPVLSWQCTPTRTSKIAPSSSGRS
jgi:hypothetical protein